MDKKEILVLPFGKKVQVGNFTVLKFTKTLTKNQLKQLRDDKGIHPDVQKQLSRAGLPFIKVEAISQIWAVEFCCNTGVYMFIDRVLPLAIVAEQEGRAPEFESIADFAHLFGMWMTDTCVQGDSIYYADKGNALKALIERQKASMSENDDKALKEVQEAENAKASIVEMANKLNEEYEN